MGALTSNSKRGEDYFTFNHNSPNSNSPEFDSHISKKPKLCSSVDLSPKIRVLPKTTACRVSQYPTPIVHIRREVHAPCRVSKFGFLARLNREPRASARVSADVMGNILGSPYEKVKSTALETLRYFKKDKEVIDVDGESVEGDESEDSSIEEVGIVDGGREGQPVVSNQRSWGTNGALAKLPESKQTTTLAVSDLRNSNLRVDNAGKMLDSLSLGRELDVLRVPVHKKLLEAADRRNPKLSSLRSEIEFYQKCCAKLQSLRPVKKPEEVVLREPFAPLTNEEEDEVSYALSNSNRRKVLVTHENSNIEITGEVLQCLKPGAWLNDEVINVYLELLKEREKREPNKFLKCHFFNTFFYKKLLGRTGYDFKSVRRWTTQRKLGYLLLDCDKIFVPVHKEVHWCLAVINKKEKKFQYLDSLRGIDTRVLKVLARYFVDEVKDKCGKDIDVTSWKEEYVEDLPEQENGSDCGMFMIKYADFYSRGVGLRFKQEHMPYFRRRTVKELLRLIAE